jgi:hypothetical protein
LGPTSYFHRSIQNQPPEPIPICILGNLAGVPPCLSSYRATSRVSQDLLTWYHLTLQSPVSAAERLLGRISPSPTPPILSHTYMNAKYVLGSSTVKKRDQHYEHCRIFAQSYLNSDPISAILCLIWAESTTGPHTLRIAYIQRNDLCIVGLVYSCHGGHEVTPKESELTSTNIRIRNSCHLKQME